MKKKSMLLFVILFTTIFAIFVSIKFFDRNKLVQLSTEFSLEKNQTVKVANKDYTNIKLSSVSETDCYSDNCTSDKIVKYTLLINGKKYEIDKIPSSISIYENGHLEVKDGDEDRLVLMVVEK